MDEEFHHRLGTAGSPVTDCLPTASDAGRKDRTEASEEAASKQPRVTSIVWIWNPHRHTSGLTRLSMVKTTAAHPSFNWIMSFHVVHLKDKVRNASPSLNDCFLAEENRLRPLLWIAQPHKKAADDRLQEEAH